MPEMHTAPPPWVGHPQPVAPAPYYQQPYAPPAPAPAPAPYAPPPTAYPPPSNPADFAASLLAGHRSLVKAAKQIAKESPDPDPRGPHSYGHPPYSAPPGNEDIDAFLARIERMDDGLLMREQQRHREGSEKWLAVQDELDHRREAAELDGDEDIDENELRTFCGVRVDDGRSGWIDVAATLQFETKSDLVQYLREKYPYATKARYGKVTKGDRVLQDGRRELSIRSPEEAHANIRKNNPVEAAALPVQPPPAPPGLSTELQILFRSLSEQQIEAQRANAALLQSIIQRPPEDGKKSIETMMLAKEMFFEPMMRIMEAGKPQPGDPRLALDLANAMTQNAINLSKVQASGGGTDGVMATINQVMSQLGPLVMRPPEQQSAPALPAPDLPPTTNAGAIMQRSVEKKLSDAISFLISGRLKTEQLPKYAFRNIKDPAEMQWLLSLDANQFANVVRNVAIAARAPAAYLSREDVRQGFLWVHGEIHRMAILIDWLGRTGRVADQAAMVDWKTPCIIPWQPQAPIIGPDADAMFSQLYPEAINAVAAGDSDLPPPDSPPPLRVVRDARPDPDVGAAPVDLFAPQPAPPQAPPQAVRPAVRRAASDPDFAT